MLLGAQYTFIEQKQSALTSPYAGPLSLYADGDRQATHTIGVYTGWAPIPGVQLYFDTEKFMGAGVSGATTATLTITMDGKATTAQLRVTAS